MRPHLSERQRRHVDEVVDGFLAAGDPGARLALRYVRTVSAHPERIGFDSTMRPCGCERGFRIVDDRGITPVVERCRVCNPPSDGT